MNYIIEHGTIIEVKKNLYLAILGDWSVKITYHEDENHQERILYYKSNYLNLDYEDGQFTKEAKKLSTYLAKKYSNEL